MLPAQTPEPESPELIAEQISRADHELTEASDQSRPALPHGTRGRAHVGGCVRWDGPHLPSATTEESVDATFLGVTDQRYDLWRQIRGQIAIDETSTNLGHIIVLG